MISVVISIYKNLDNLDLILQGLSRGSYKDFEVIVSEDNNADIVSEFIKNARSKYPFTIKHVNQEDNGFRKTKILNQTVLASEGEYLVFLDGDCVPHKHLLKSYNKFLAPNTVCMGKRNVLKEEITKRIYQRKTLKGISPFYLMLKSENPESGLYIPWEKPENNYRLILGCNFGIARQLLIDINGFDEDYEQAGVGEDHDIDWRLRKAGARFLNIKHTVIVYHLYHKHNYDSRITLEMNQLLKKKLKLGHVRCLNGIDKLQSSDIDIDSTPTVQKEWNNINHDLQKQVFELFRLSSSDSDFNVSNIKYLNILKQCNKYGIDPCLNSIVIMPFTEEGITADKTEQLLSYLAGYKERQVLIVGEGKNLNTDWLGKYPQVISLINRISEKDKISFIAHSQYFLSAKADDLEIAAIVRTPNSLIDNFAPNEIDLFC